MGAITSSTVDVSAGTRVWAIADFTISLDLVLLFQQSPVLNTSLWYLTTHKVPIASPIPFCRSSNHCRPTPLCLPSVRLATDYAHLGYAKYPVGDDGKVHPSRRTKG